MGGDIATLWGIHMGQQVGLDPIEGNYVGIGWEELGDLSQLPNDREAFKHILRTKLPEAKEASIRTQTSSVFRFVHGMKQGDFVVYPSKVNRLVYIGQVVGDYVHKIDVGDEGYPNRRAVKWLTPDGVERGKFSQAALYEIGAFMTLFEVKVNVSEFFEQVKSNVSQPVSLPSTTYVDEQINDVTSQQIANVAAESTVDFIIRQLHTQLTGYEFEAFIAHLLTCMGYTAYATQKSGDGGVDVIAHKDAFGFEPPVIKVQCKRSLSSNGTPEINQLLGTLGDGEYGLFVNLGSYSKDARAIERSKSKLTLVDGQAVVELIFKHYHQLAPHYRALLPLKQIFVPDL